MRLMLQESKISKKCENKEKNQNSRITLKACNPQRNNFLYSSLFFWEIINLL